MAALGGGGARYMVSGVVGAVGGLLAGKYLANTDITWQEPAPASSTPLPGSRSLTSPLSSASRAAKILAWGTPRPPSPGPLVYTNHVLEYDAARKVPRWVAEHLTRDSVNQTKANRKGVQFGRDPALPALFSSDNSDYWGSGPGATWLPRGTTSTARPAWPTPST